MQNEDDSGGTGDTGSTGDTGDQSTDDVTICEGKREEFDDLNAKFQIALEAWQNAHNACEDAKQVLDEAWRTVKSAEGRLKAAEQQRSAGNPNQANIDEARARIAQIDAIDPESALDRLIPRLMADEPGGDDDAWMQANYYLGLIQERAELEAQIEQWEQFDPAELDAAVAAAESALQTAKENRTAKHAIFVQREVEAQDLHDKATNARNLAVNARNRYIDFGCPAILKKVIEEPEEIRPKAKTG